MHLHCVLASCVYLSGHRAQSDGNLTTFFFLTLYICLKSWIGNTLVYPSGCPILWIICVISKYSTNWFNGGVSTGRSNEPCSLLVVISFTHFNPKCVPLSLPSSTPMSPCLTTWGSPVSLLSWSMRTTTAPSSASPCTTSACRKTRLLAPRCSESWWVSQIRDAVSGFSSWGCLNLH